ncbi:MAG: translation initiation factor IF-2 subunit beta [Candidatus Woesearchaeota archaeon]
MDSYEKLLESAYSVLPEKGIEKERFEIPKVTGRIQGNRTIISNFFQIAALFNRPPEHVLKYVLKELATPGEIKRNFVIFGTKISATKINEKLAQYAEEYVICKECGKPDTKLIKEGDYLFMKCMACGAKHNVKSRI